MFFFIRKALSNVIRETDLETEEQKSFPATQIN